MIHKLRGRSALCVAISSVLALASLPVTGAGAGSEIASEQINSSQYAKLVGEDGKVHVIVQLARAPAVDDFARMLAQTGDGLVGRMAAGAASVGAVTAVTNEQARFMGVLNQSGIAYQEIYAVQRVLNAVVLRVLPADIERLRALEGVQRAELLALDEPTNSTSVPFVGAPNVWGNTVGLPAGATGTGMRIGIIDTGVDYQHPQFGGAGTLVNYQANDRTVITDQIGGVPIFPTAKVSGGFDFAGDAYSGGAAPPVPDPDPMDCNGHGTHVAGTAAGLGVQQVSNATYPGPYDAATNYGTLKIGPGIAPGAQLYAYRVFGCGGSTGLTVLAIDRSTDPDNNGDLSDRLDVINMSLGSNYGFRFDASAVASDNATLSGMIVVASAGNAGDTFFISGSPGSGSQVISTASALDNGLAGPLRVDAPAAIGGFYTTGTASFGSAPPNAGLPGNVVLADDGSTAPIPPSTGGTINDGCQTPFVNAAAVAGNIALVERGACGFKLKALNAQLNGAIGVIIANNAAGAPPGMADDPAIPNVTIPALSITLPDSTTFRANMPTPGVSVTMFHGGDTISGFTSRGPRGGGDPLYLKPDLAAPGSSITSAQTGVTCTGTAPSSGCQVANATGFLPNGATLVLSGTSMAAPHVAGTMALLRQLNPSRSVEELKAIAINTARHELSLGPNGSVATFAASRAGAGRVDVAAAATDKIIAYNDDVPGAVAVTFDVEVTGTTTTTRNVRLVNRTAVIQNVTLSMQTLLDGPGVSFSLPGSTAVTLPPSGSATFAVQLSADATQMDRFRDPTMAATQSVTAPAFLAGLGNVARHYLAEEAALVKVSQGANELARIPVYMAYRPRGTVQAPGSLPPIPGGAGTINLPLTGTSVCTGTAGAGTCTVNAATEHQSLVTPLELQLTNTPTTDPNVPAFADVQYAGVGFEPASGNYLFGFAAFAKKGTLGNTSYNICIDANEDGTYEKVVFNSDLGQMAQRLFGVATSGQDNFIMGSFTPPGTVSVISPVPLFPNLVSAAVADTGIHDSNVVVLPGNATLLGLAAGDTKFKYAIAVCPGFNPVCVRLTTPTSCSSTGAYESFAGPFTYDSATPGVTASGGLAGSALLPAVSGTNLALTVSQANLAANGSFGVLLLHHQNTLATSAQALRAEDLFSDGFEDL